MAKKLTEKQIMDLYKDGKLSLRSLQNFCKKMATVPVLASTFKVTEEDKKTKPKKAKKTSAKAGKLRQTILKPKPGVIGGFFTVEEDTGEGVIVEEEGKKDIELTKKALAAAPKKTKKKKAKKNPYEEFFTRLAQGKFKDQAEKEHYVKVSALLDNVATKKLQNLFGTTDDLMVKYVAEVKLHKRKLLGQNGNGAAKIGKELKLKVKPKRKTNKKRTKNPLAGMSSDLLSGEPLPIAKQVLASLGGYGFVGVVGFIGDKFKVTEKVGNWLFAKDNDKDEKSAAVVSALGFLVEVGIGIAAARRSVTVKKYLPAALIAGGVRAMRDVANGFVSKKSKTFRTIMGLPPASLSGYEPWISSLGQQTPYQLGGQFPVNETTAEKIKNHLLR